MRSWTYSYKSSDGLRHEAVISAPSKDDVYSELRKRNIRPIRVDERIAPVVRRGFRGLRKREWAVLTVSFLLVILLAVLLSFVMGETESMKGKPTPPTPKVAPIHLGTHPVYLHLVGEVDRTLETFRKRRDRVDWELLSNYALIEKSVDMTDFQAEISRARNILEAAKSEMRNVFEVHYAKIPEEDENDRVGVRRLYGIAMGEFDQMEERIFSVECALELLAANRDKWRVVKGAVLWSDKDLEREFSLFMPDQFEGTARWRRDFGEGLPSEGNENASKKVRDE